MATLIVQFVYLGFMILIDQPWEGGLHPIAPFLQFFILKEIPDGRLDEVTKMPHLTFSELF